MTTNRLEAFSDGVIAIIITIMVLELKVPHAVEQASHTAVLADLKPLLSVFLSYILSFVYVGTYWNNHHHLFHATRHVTGGILWANLHLLFWLSLFPFTTGWMGENRFAPVPTAASCCSRASSISCCNMPSWPGKELAHLWRRQSGKTGKESSRWLPISPPFRSPS